nr:ATP-binding protein [Skermania piniformis]
MANKSEAGEALEQLTGEVAARNSSGTQLRIRAAGFAARKTIEEFDWDVQPAVRQQIASLASGGFLTEARNIVLGSVRPEPAEPTSRPDSGSLPRTTDIACSSQPQPVDHPAHRRPPCRKAPQRALPVGQRPLRTRLADPDVQPALQRLGAASSSSSTTPTSSL